MTLSREDFVADCLTKWIDAGLTLDQMTKVSGLVADALELADAKNEPIGEMFKAAAADPRPNGASAGGVVNPLEAGIDMALNPVRGIATGLFDMASNVASKGTQFALDTVGTGVGYAVPLGIAGLAAPYFAGRYVGRSAAKNMDEYGTAVQNVKDREMLSALRTEAAKLRKREEEVAAAQLG
jgi:hypothetical protein